MNRLFQAIFLGSLTVLLAGCAGALVTASVEGDVNAVKTLMGSKSNTFDKEDICDALYIAASHGHIELVKYLLNSGRGDVNCNYGGGRTPLITASDHNRTEVAKFLLERGADVNAKDFSGRNALILTSWQGNTDMAKLLISKGADLDGAIAYNEGDLAKDSSDRLAKTGLVLLEKIKNQLPATRADKPVSSDSASYSAIKSDIDEFPLTKLKPNKNAYAIVIGIENYRQKLPKVDFAVSDAKLVSDYLSKAMGYPEENIVTLLNENASNVDLAKYFEQWLANNVEKGSTVFVYYSGHGAPNPKTGDAYLVPYDGDPAFIEKTGYSLKRLYDALGKLPAKEIIVGLDSCFSGAGGRSVVAEGSRPLVMNLENSLTISKNMTILAAASGNQISSTYKEKGHGLFTYFFLKGIKNEDVIRQDGSLAIGDLFTYVKPQVERIARKQYNNEQTPQLIGRQSHPD